MFTLKIKAFTDRRSGRKSNSLRISDRLLTVRQFNRLIFNLVKKFRERICVRKQETMGNTIGICCQCDVYIDELPDWFLGHRYYLLGTDSISNES